MSDELTEAQQKAKAAQDALVADYHRTFGSDAGQRVYVDLMRMAGVDEICFDAVSESNTGFLLGRRSLALRIKKFYEMKPEAKKEQPALTNNGS
jgi:hypothetical protein